MLDTCDNKNEYLKFEKYFIDALNKNVPKKAKIFPENYKPKINKTLYQTII